MKYVAIYNTAKHIWELGYNIGARFHVIARYPA